MSVLSKPYFHDEAAAFAHVEATLWADGRVCPHCGTVDNSYALKGVRSKPSKKNPEGVERHGLYKCSGCRKQFTVRIGTIFEESHLELHKWLQAIHLMCSSKKGVSAHQLHRILEVQYKTAWFLAHRIREAMRLPLEDQDIMGGPSTPVEMDETYVGGKEKNKPKSQRAIRHRDGKRIGGGVGKAAVFSMVERGGKVRSMASPPPPDVVSQPGHLDGTVISLWGKDTTVPVRVQNDGAIYRCSTTREVARQLGAHIFGEPLRLSGEGKWTRSSDGTWKLDVFKIYSFDRLDTRSLLEVVADLRAVGGEWQSVDDPWAELQALRHGDEE